MAKFNTEDYSRTKVATWLGSGEFQFAMDNAFTNILKGAHSAKSEADTANVFEREIYFLLRQQFGIDIDIQKEVSVSREEIPDDEKPFEIPESWVWARLGEIGSWASGATPSRTHSEYYGGSILWLKTGDLTDGYVSSIPEFVTDLALEKTL